MGGTLPICPFCGVLKEGLKDHIKAKHPEQYRQWITDDQLPYWRYKNGVLRALPCTPRL